MDHSSTREQLQSASGLENSVEADIRAELDSHLELCAEQIVGRGLSGEELTTAQARVLARERFGDFETTVRACRRQKLGARIMLQRLNLLATSALLVAVLFFGFRSYSLDRTLSSLTQGLERQIAALEVRSQVAFKFVPPSLEPVFVRPGDSIELRSTYYPAELNTTEALASDGTVLLPELGHVQVAGMTRDELESRLTELYTPYFDLLDLHVKVHKGE